jgi:hypothetical protein
MNPKPVVFLFGVCSMVASAQVGEISLSLGASTFRNNKLGSSSDLASTFTVKDGFRIGARLTLNTKRFIGHEFGYAYSRSKLGLLNSSDNVSMPVHQGMYNFLLYALPEGTRVRPFVTGGGHFSTFYPPGASVSYGTGTTKFGVNYGGGIKVKVSPMFAIRLDLRDYVTGKPFDLVNKKGALHQIEVSAGVGIYF